MDLVEVIKYIEIKAPPSGTLVRSQAGCTEVSMPHRQLDVVTHQRSWESLRVYCV